MGGLASKQQWAVSREAQDTAQSHEGNVEQLQRGDTTLLLAVLA